MADGQKIDFTEDRVFPVGNGIVYRVVCAPRSWSNDKISDDVSTKDPPGTMANRWVVADDEMATDHHQWKHPTARKQCPDCECVP